MSTFVTTKSYHEVKKNGKVIDKKMLDAAYDGNKAIIDSYDNNKAHRFEFSKQDIQQMMEKYLSNRSNKFTRSRKPCLLYTSPVNQDVEGPGFKDVEGPGFKDLEDVLVHVDNNLII